MVLTGPSVLRVPACAVAMALSLPAPAYAQRTLLALPISGPSTLLSASGRHVVALTHLALVADDRDGEPDAYRYALDTGTWQRVSFRQLLGLSMEASILRSAIVPLVVSEDGRYFAYESRRSPDDPRQLVRYDFATGERLVVRDDSQDPYSNPTMSRDGSTFAWLGERGAVHVGRAEGPNVVVGAACVYPRGPVECAQRPALTADGRRVFYQREQFVSVVGALESFDRGTNRAESYPPFGVAPWSTLAVNATGSHVVGTGYDGRSRVLDVATGLVEAIPPPSNGDRVAISDDGVYVLNASGQVYDRRWSAPLASGAQGSVGMSADGRIVAVTLDGVFLVLDLDGDDDGMRDPWESVFGLSPVDPLDALADDDADGVMNRDEYAARSHPRGFVRRYFAEGVSSELFETTVFVTRVGGNYFTGLAPTTVTFFGDDGSSAARTLKLHSFAGEDVSSATPPPIFTARQYGILVEAEGRFGADRMTTWPAGFPTTAAHASSGGWPSTTWFFAEGATGGPFELFYLLWNPGDLDATVTVTYLCATGQPIRRDHVVPARRRYTIWVDQEGPALASAECGAHLESSRPIVAERSLYIVGPDGFQGGTSATGAPAASESWAFAEGDTRAPFDMFLLLANPSASPAYAQVIYELEGGGVVRRWYDVPAGARRTVWVDQEGPELAAAALSMRIESTEPIVAERSMWWRGAWGAGWVEGHTEVGATTAHVSWAAGHVPESAQFTFYNPGTSTGLVRITMTGPNGIGAAAADVALPPGRTRVSPTTLWPALGPQRYSASMEALPVGSGPVPFIVERTSYAPGMTAGTALLATPLP